MLKASGKYPAVKIRILLALGTGLRQGDIDALKISNIDFERNCISTTSRKTKKSMASRPVSAEVMEELSNSEICRREGIAASVYYKWSKSFLEAGKHGLTRAVIRDATSEEVKQLKSENTDLKKAVAELVLEVQRYKKSLGM